MAKTFKQIFKEAENTVEYWQEACKLSLEENDALLAENKRLIEALTLAINRFETIADGIDNGDCDSIAPTLLRRAANTADKALKGEK